MNAYLLFFLLTVSSCLLNAQAPTGKTYAVVIGISTYESKALPALQYADKDAAAFAAYMQSKAGGHVPADNIKLLLNDQATLAAISDAIDWLRDSCQENDIAYLYFSGHGDVETKSIDSLGFLLAWNTPPNNYRNNAIRIADVNSDANTLSVIKKARVVLITDACHAGKLAGDAIQGRQLAARQLRLVRDNEVRLASCRPDEEAAEGPDWGGGRGVFSYYLLMGLKGLADAEHDGRIKLREINAFMDSCFANDRFLALGNHQQHPVSEGQPTFQLATVDTVTASSLRRLANISNASPNGIPLGLASFKPLGLVPADSVINYLGKIPFEGIVRFTPFLQLPVDSLPARILDSCIAHYNEIDSLYLDQLMEGMQQNTFPALETFKRLRAGITNKTEIRRFNNRLMQMIHNRGQLMVNDYLQGKIAELERRQYYYKGKETYRNFLVMHSIGCKLLQPGQTLEQNIYVQHAYLQGLDARLQMLTATNPDSLYKIAFKNQQTALSLEPFAAYVHNELGLLFVYKKQFDSAAAHLQFAAALAPTWAIPWSNMITLWLEMGQFEKASQAAEKARQLQPGNAFIMMNEGLLKEKQHNWLAASALFQQSISINQTHFLPYQRLGQCYLQTADYALADSFLYEASQRVKGIAATEDIAGFSEQFYIGVRMMMMKKEPKEYDLAATKQIPEAFINLLRGLQAFSNGAWNNAVQYFKKAIAGSPDIPLAQHYLGFALLQQGKWQLAEAPLLKALDDYRVPGNLVYIFNEGIQPVSERDSAAMVRDSLLSFSYTPELDHFLLAKVYDKRQLINKAVDHYQAAVMLESNVLKDEAAHLRRSIRKLFTGSAWLGLSRLLESEGDYLRAENVLLQQLGIVHTAAYTGQTYEHIADGPIISEAKQSGNNNYYWLIINKNIESEIYNFYIRMQSRFPNEAEWFQKAGLFLYHRLEPVYRNMPPSYYAGFRAALTYYPFPWTAPSDTTQQVMVKMPGTGDTLIIDYPGIDPLAKALECMQKAMAIAKTGLPSLQMAFVLAKLNSWMGNKSDALNWYAEALVTDKDNRSIQNDYLSYLMGVYELPAAKEQLQAMPTRRADQLFTLAGYHMLSGQFDTAVALLNECRQTSEIKKADLMEAFARLYHMAGQPKRALLYRRDSLVAIKELPGDSINMKQKNCFRLYSIARTKAMLSGASSAMDALSTALDAGFGNYYYALTNDNAWEKVKKTKKWQELLKKYAVAKDYSANSHAPFVNIYWYLIPQG